MDAESARGRWDRGMDVFWERHANPKSGWSRILVGPLLLLALYRRDWRLGAIAVVATVVNPVAFPRPDPETTGWMTRGVRAERWWLEQGRGAFGVGWPNMLNTINVPTFLYSMYAAYSRRPGRAILCFVASMALKFGWIEAIARRYDATDDDR